MPKGKPNKRYTSEFKKHVVETMREEGLSFKETERRYELPHNRAAAWERIYLTEGAEGFEIERRGRGSKGRPPKLDKIVEDDLIAENQRLRAEVAYLKKLAGLGFGRRATPAQKTQVIEKLRPAHSMEILLLIAGLPRSTYYYHTKRQAEIDKYHEVKEVITAIYREHKGRYGYRRITAEMRNRGFLLNHKTVQRLMNALGLVCRVRMKKIHVLQRRSGQNCSRPAQTKL